MRILTLTQPWATLVAIGAKRIETRGWRTPYTGDVAIHAAKGLGAVGGARGLEALCATDPFDRVLARHGLAVGDLPRGAVVCVARLERCVRMSGELRGLVHEIGLTAQEHAFGHYAPGRWAWLLDDVRPLERPVPMRGSLGLTAIDDPQARKLARLATATTRKDGSHE
jgi:hypothetical protein